MTRYEKMKTLTLEEMASVLSDLQWDSNEPTTPEMIMWLEGEYREDPSDLVYAATGGLKNIATAQFVSVWDGGYEMYSPCTVDLSTGKILFVEIVDTGDYVNTLDRECVRIKGKEYDITYDEHNEMYIVTKEE